jgi:hypothetical protein
MKLGLSGSTIKSWFQYRCERKTRYELMMPQDRAAVPISDDGREKSWAVLGVDYEKRVMARLMSSHAVLAPSADADSLREDVATAFMRGEVGASYAAQVNLRPSKIGDLLNSDALSLRRTFADLVRRDVTDQNNCFTVIDIKATRSPRAFHKTQVAYYALLLRAILAERGIQGKVSPFGEIWFIPPDGDTQGDEYCVDQFELGPYLRLVEDFMKVGLPEIASREVSARRDETFFHLFFKCEQCSYLSHCRRAIDPSLPAAQRDVSAVPGLSHESKRMLRQHGIDTVGKLAHGAKGVGRLDGVNWSLARKAEQLIVRANAIEQCAILSGVEEQTFLMPPYSDVVLVLLVDHDPVDDGMVSLGYLCSSPQGEAETIEIMPTASRQAEADALIAVFSKVIADLQAIDEHNATLNPDDPAALRAHIFFYEPAESRSLQGAIERHLTDPRVRSGLLHMVRLFPPEDVVPEPEFRGIDHLPATVVRSVVEQLFALPATVSYDLRQVSQALVAGGDFFEPYLPEASFERPFSSLLSIEISRSLREGKGGAGLVDEVRSDVRQRLRSTLAIIRWLELMHASRVAEGKAPLLRLTKRPFRFQATFNPIDMEDLDVLAALELLENRSGILEALISLALPVQLRVNRGTAAGPLRLIKVSNSKGRYNLTFQRTPSAMSSEIPRGGLGLALSDGSAEALLDPRKWSQMNCNLLEPRSFEDASLVRVWMREDVYNSPMFHALRRSVPDAGWWLDQTFFDVNSLKSETYLRYLGERVT